MGELMVNINDSQSSRMDPCSSGFSGNGNQSLSFQISDGEGGNWWDIDYLEG